MATCRDCKLFDLEKTKDKAGRVRKDRAAKCLWVSTETWPMSVPESMNRRPTAGYMTVDDGNRCKRFIPLTPNAALEGRAQDNNRKRGDAR